MDKTIKTLSFVYSSRKKWLILCPSTIQKQGIKVLLLLYQTFVLSASEQLKANSVNLKDA